MREAKAFTFSEALTKCITTWYIGRTAVITTAEDTPPKIGEIFRLGFRDYSVELVIGAGAARSAQALIVPKKAEPCA